MSLKHSAVAKVIHISKLLIWELQHQEFEPLTLDHLVLSLLLGSY